MQDAQWNPKLNRQFRLYIHSVSVYWFYRYRTVISDIGEKNCINTLAEN